MTIYKSIYFTLDETGCRCRKCDRIQGMPDEDLKMADRLRDNCGFSLPMSSGYRCPLHSQNPFGPHSEGGFDIKIYGERAFILVREAYKLGYTGIGHKQKGPLYTRFIHLDRCIATIDRQRPWEWSY